MEKVIKGRKYQLREGTLDEYIAKENCYSNCEYKSTDIWLDLGGNIGMFPVTFADRVNLVVSFEPEVENCKLFVENIRLNGIKNCQLIQKAVVHDSSEQISFFINTKKNKGAHSTLVKRGRDEVIVPAVNINEVLEAIDPNKIKMDIEGGEYEIIKAVKDWSNIEELIFEYHISILRDSDGKKLQEIYEILGKHFTKIDGKKPSELGKNWIIIIHCKK